MLRDVFTSCRCFEKSALHERDGRIWVLRRAKSLARKKPGKKKPTIWLTWELNSDSLRKFVLNVLRCGAGLKGLSLHPELETPAAI